MTGTSHKYWHKYLIISRSVLPRMIIFFSDENCRDNPNTYFMFNNPFFFENPAVYEKMWKNIVEYGRPLMTIRCMCIACWIPKTTNTHLQYVILIAFPQHRWLHERISVLRYTYIRCLVMSVSVHLLMMSSAFMGYQVLFGWQNRGELDGKHVQHKWEIKWTSLYYIRTAYRMLPSGA